MWISVKDRLPIDPPRKVDVWRKGIGRYTDCICNPKSHACHPNGVPLATWSYMYADVHLGGPSVTHWMEMPEPPEETSDGTAIGPS
ncbi:Protein of unknown function [Singulisphaera sp. GP187]|uniref:DUF551 domain-containing protein n=1 Tax=Singulisphaera sp. GP187 TaxID=1882752 RepID=UPI0009284FA2|nr:Protein of unknown function [Singulisphaera sp. GP187]